MKVYELKQSEPASLQPTHGLVTFVQNGRDQNHQVGVTTGAEDAGKHEEDRTPEE